jgi:branched-chain amino acid transport system permease protein
VASTVSILKRRRQAIWTSPVKWSVAVICIVGLCAALILSGQVTLSALIEGTIYGLCNGGLYILIALGLTLLFGMMGIINFAHGAIYMLGAFVVYYFFGQFGLPFVVVLIPVFVFLAVFGVLMERFLYRPLRGNEEAVLVVFLGLNMLLESSGWLGFGTMLKSVPRVFPGMVDSSFVTISVERVVVVPITAALLVALYFLLQYTRYGKAMRAVSQDADAAALQRINVNRIRALAFALSFGLAAIGGALVAPMGSVSPAMGFRPLLMSMIIIIVGGLGSLRGAVVGALIIGVFESTAALVVGPDIAYLLLFVFILVFLIFKPAGLFGNA